MLWYKFKCLDRRFVALQESNRLEGFVVPHRYIASMTSRRYYAKMDADLHHRYAFALVSSLRSSQQLYVVLFTDIPRLQMIVAVALPGGRLQLSDIYGNFLLEFMTENYDDIVEI